MPTPFHQKINLSLENPALQAALDGNAERRLSARQQAYSSLPEDLQIMRYRAHNLRAHTVAHLEEYLEQFTTRATANGIIIHRAADAAEAVKTVLEIVAGHRATLVAKSKTMVGEEIDINAALAGAGVSVVETDLGEYIVQLRGEPPAHIITPAVHLRRSDVARTFEEKLGMPYTEDIPVMTALARRVLRQVFLDAQVGISGVNMGVAESGTLCLFTNEGNGRMVTTLPPVHIALMGIERLVPTMDDMALLAALLPRSATGQKLTVYTSLIHGPRRPGEVDGPAERHLVLLDNGRRALLGSPLEEALYCIRCGACLNACPVFRELGGHAYVGTGGRHTPYPGPIGSVISPGLFGQLEYGHLARASSLCGACKEACPVDIDLPGLLLRVRAGGKQLVRDQAPPHVSAGLKVGLQAFGWMASSPARFAAAQGMAGLFARLAKPFSAWLPMPAFTGWGYSKDFPLPAAQSFQARWASRGQASPAGVSPEAAPVNPPLEQEVTLTGQAAVLGPEARKEAQPELLKQFEAELLALGGKIYFCSPEQAAGKVLTIFQASGITAIQAWDRAYLPAGLVEALAADGIQVRPDPDPTLRGGLTGALAAAADTATLALPGGPGQPLTASLTPEVHVAILRAADVTARLVDVLRRPEVWEASATALVSGPSRTADIEMTLTIGVHGPGELHVVCVV